MAADETQRFRDLATIVRAELAIERATKAAFKAWLPAVVDAVLHGKSPGVELYPHPVIAATEDEESATEEAAAAAVLMFNPDAAEMTRALWAALAAGILVQVARVFDRQMSAHAPDVPASERATARETYLASVRDRLNGLPDAVFVRVQEVVSQGIKDGIGHELLARRVREVLSPLQHDYQTKAKLVGRTEGIAVYNGATYQAYLALSRAPGKNFTKTWVSIRDTRVRHTHRVANGQRVSLATKFNVGGFACAYPGDPTLPASEAANCRCVARYGSSMTNGDDVTPPIVAQASEVVACIDEAYLASGALPNGWRGPMAPIGKPTGDGRQLNAPETGIRTRELPITFDWAPSREGGHDGAVMAGRIDYAWLEELDGQLYLFGEGAIDTRGQNGAEYARQLADGFAMFVSVDPDEVTFETQFFDEDGEQVPFDDAVMVGEDGETLREGYSVLDVMTDWRLAGVTAVTIPAFQEARIAPVYDYKPRTAVQAKLDEGIPPLVELMDMLDAAFDDDDLNELARAMKARRAYDILAEDEIVAAVTGSMSYPVFADRKRKWDGHSARQNVAKWASSDGSGDPDKINWKRFGSCFLYMGEPNTGNSLDGTILAEKPKKPTATWNVEQYKGGFVDIIDGKPYIVANAVIGLAGGHGVEAMDVPGPAKKAMLGKLKTLYGKMKRVFPDFPTFPFALSGDLDSMATWNSSSDAWTGPVDRFFGGSTVATVGGASRSTGAPDAPPSDVSRAPNATSASSAAELASSNISAPLRATGVASAPSVANGTPNRRPNTSFRSDSENTVSIVTSTYACGDMVVESVGPPSVIASTSTATTSTTTTEPASSEASSARTAIEASVSSRTNHQGCERRLTTSNDPEMVAAAGQVFNLASFENPKLAGPTPLTVKDGKVYGHVALFESCYMAQGGARSCIKPPKGGDYSRFLTHGARLTDGEVLPVGMITFGEGHFAGGSLKASMANYANLATGAAKVNCGEDEWGVWVAGEVVAAFSDRADDLLLSPLSGHWEPDLDRGGALTLIAAHVVVTPGFHVPRLVATIGDDGQVTSALISGPFTFLEGSAELFDAAVEDGKVEVVGAREDGVVLYEEVVAAVRADRRAQRALAKLKLDADSRASVALQRLGVRG